MHTMHDSGENAMNRTVNGFWSGGYSGTDACTTDGGGQCTLISPLIRIRRPSVTFAVDGLTHAALPYELADSANL